MRLLEVQSQLGKVQGIHITGAVNLVNLGIGETAFVVDMPLAGGLCILDFQLSGFAIGQVKLLCQKVLHILDGEPCSPKGHPDVLRGDVSGLHFLQSLYIGIHVPELVIIDTQLLMLAAADEVFHLFVVGLLVCWPPRNNIPLAVFLPLLIQMDVIGSSKLLMQVFVVGDKIRLEKGIHTDLGRHELQHILDSCSAFIMAGNTLDAMPESLQHKDRVIPVFRRAVVTNLPHGSCHVQHEFPVSLMVLVVFTLITFQFIQAVNGTLIQTPCPDAAIAGTYILLGVLHDGVDFLLKIILRGVIRLPVGHHDTRYS